MVVQDIRNGVVGGKMLDGSNFTPNAESTADRKGFNKRLVGKGRHFIDVRSYKIDKATPQKQQAEISFRDDKWAEIAMYNQTPTGNGTIAKEDAAIFYGISERANKDIEKDINDTINKSVDNELMRAGFRKL